MKFYKDEIIYSILYNINGYMYVMKNTSVNISSDEWHLKSSCFLFMNI